MTKLSIINQLQSIAHSGNYYGYATRKQIIVINMLLSEYSEREERLALLTMWFGHPFTSSKELTMGEASAIIDLAFQIEWVIDPKFIYFIKVCLEDYYAF